MAGPVSQMSGVSWKILAHTCPGTASGIAPQWGLYQALTGSRGRYGLHLLSSMGLGKLPQLLECEEGCAGGTYKTVVQK